VKRCSPACWGCQLSPKPFCNSRYSRFLLNADQTTPRSINLADSLAIQNFLRGAFGRISVSCRVEGGVREEPGPATVATERFQAQLGFVPGRAPELPGAFEPALRLPRRPWRRQGRKKCLAPPAVESAGDGLSSLSGLG
jgi:hypothetical protein